MPIISIIGQKGGTGKTTITTGLAVAAIEAGYTAVIIDTDPQLSAIKWKARRRFTAAPAVKDAYAENLPLVLEAVADADFIFIDTPGKISERPPTDEERRQRPYAHLSPAAIAAAKAADLVLIPTRQQIFEIDTLADARLVIEAAGGPAATVVLNGVHPNATNPIDDMRELIAASFGLPIAPSFLSHRNTFLKAPASGKGPQEYEPDGKAAQEMRELFRFVALATTQQQDNTTTEARAYG